MSVEMMTPRGDPSYFDPTAIVPKLKHNHVPTGCPAHSGIKLPRRNIAALAHNLYPALSVTFMPRKAKTKTACRRLGTSVVLYDKGGPPYPPPTPLIVKMFSQPVYILGGLSVCHLCALFCARPNQVRFPGPIVVENGNFRARNLNSNHQRHVVGSLYWFSNGFVLVLKGPPNTTRVGDRGTHCFSIYIYILYVYIYTHYFQICLFGSFVNT